ncbi:hypothetical protein B0J18DRAFT_153899 [Chaetomium sp. MPI-SDFR-AT-0129]|nr:hypothetical protein B0J18DRAFT_153899 [Chaetomium sp. MPI-SDFR-AT-0129]
MSRDGCSAACSGLLVAQTQPDELVKHRFGCAMIGFSQAVLQISYQLYPVYCSFLQRILSLILRSPPSSLVSLVVVTSCFSCLKAADTWAQDSHPLEPHVVHSRQPSSFSMFRHWRPSRGWGAHRFWQVPTKSTRIQLNNLCRKRLGVGRLAEQPETPPESVAENARFKKDPRQKLRRIRVHFPLNCLNLLTSAAREKKMIAGNFPPR